MAEAELKNNYLSLYAQNADWKERVLKDDCEIVKYQNDSSVRIWYNEQSESYAPHWHTAMEVIMPVENYYDVITASNSYHIEPGEILVIPSGEMHQLIAPESGIRFIFLFDLSVITKLRGFTAIQTQMTTCIYINKTSFPQIYDDFYQLFVPIRNEYFSLNELRELAIYSHLLNFFILYGKNHLNNVQLFPNVRIYKQQEYLQKFNDVLDYIDAHYTEDLTLDAVASYSGFSKYHFTRLFKQYANTTFYDYLSCKRIKVAEQLLTEPELSITEIAFRSGFSSISTFNRIFRQQKSCTPSEYRSYYCKMQP